MSTESTKPRQPVASLISRVWWLVLLRGVLLMILGGYALIRPGISLLALTQVVGIFLVAEGILAVVAAAVGETSSRGWTFLRGVVVILVGTFVFAHSAIVAGVTTTVVMYLIAFAAILSGVLEIMGAIQDRKQIHGEGWLILGGVLQIILGGILLAAPMAFGLLLVRVLGAYAIVNGMLLIMLAFRLRGIGKG